MNVEIRQVTVDEKEILRNLLEKYDYEFSQWDQRDVDRSGLYGYAYLDHYWTEANRWACFILVDDRLAGFAMINAHPEIPEPMDYALAEFCIMPKYRRHGIGRIAAYQVFDSFHGKWQLKRHPHNISSVHFWNAVISDYTKGNYRLIESYPDIVYDDGTPADVFLFEN